MNSTLLFSSLELLRGWDVSQHVPGLSINYIEFSPSSFLALGTVAAVLIHWVVSCFRASPKLSQLPGPWYAPFTTLHLKWGFARGTIWKDVERGHRKYGDVMRLGPRQIWVASKDGVQKILHTIDLPKVTMYAEISRDRNSPGLFGEM
jgi:hypothetical protein